MKAKNRWSKDNRKLIKTERNLTSPAIGVLAAEIRHLEPSVVWMTFRPALFHALVKSLSPERHKNSSYDAARSTNTIGMPVPSCPPVSCAPNGAGSRPQNVENSSKIRVGLVVV